MGTSKNESSLASALFGKVKLAILALLFVNSDRSFFVREIVRAVDGGQGAVQRELTRLLEVGLVERRIDGRQVYYMANKANPLFPDLRSIVIKTVGMADVIRDALEPIRGRIGLAIVYGSVARGNPEPMSDVDVLVVGDIEFGEVIELLAPVQEQIEREVNPSVFSVSEFLRRVAKKGDFVARAWNGEKIFVIGDESGLG